MYFKKNISEITNYYFQIFSEINECCGILVIGSIAKKIFSENSDIDLLILTKSDLDDYSIIYNFFKKFNINNYCKSDDIYVIETNDIKVSFAFRNYFKFIEYLYEVTDGNFLDVDNKAWSIGGSIKEVILSDMKGAYILYDRYNEYLILQHLLNKAYPSVLRTAIIEYTDYYISEKTKIVNTQSNIILYNIGLSEIVVQYVRYLYALYRVFLPGIKHLANYRYIIEEKELSRDIKDLFKNYNNALKIISGKRSLK